jgi:hypothetical protein
MDFESYINKDSYPVKPKFPSAKLVTPEDHRKHADELEKYNTDQKVWVENCDEWKKKQTDLNAKFKEDALKNIFQGDFDKFPKLINVIWEKAYAGSHSNGFEEVFNSLLDLSEIVEAVKEDLKGN